jgi:hypothetical protein
MGLQEAGDCAKQAAGLLPSSVAMALPRKPTARLRPPRSGEWILRNRPVAVVVETACHAAHGAWPGNVFSCADQVLGSDGGFFQRMFCQVGAGRFGWQGAEARLWGGARSLLAPWSTRARSQEAR